MDHHNSQIEDQTVTVENVEIEDQSGYGMEEETEKGEMEVMIITSEDFSRLVQIQNVEQHWEVTQDMESQQIIHVENLDEIEENSTTGRSGDLVQQQCSQIIQIAFDSTVQNAGAAVDTGQTETNDIQLSDHIIGASTDTGETQDKNDVHDNVPNETVMMDIVDLGSRESELQRSVMGFVYQADLCCIVCGESFSDMESLKLHSASHSEEELYACAVCDLKFRERRSLSLHMLQHTNKDEPHECAECNQRFRHESAWRRHNTRFHITDFSGPTACSECRKVFKTETTLRRHNQIMHESSPALVVYFDKDESTLQYSCSKCSMSFSSEETLSRHCGTKHSGVLCYYCDQVFMNKMLLKQHSKDIHNPERPYACYKCWKRFTNGPEAKAHLAEAHNINMVRPVGVGRQKDDMYSTNFYDKTKLVQNAFVLPNKPDTSKRRSPKPKVVNLLLDEPSNDDLAARLKGRLSEHPRLVAKRKTKDVLFVNDPELPITDPHPQMTPCFTPPKQFRPPGIHIRKTKWGAAESREDEHNEQEQEDDISPPNSTGIVSMPTWTMEFTSQNSNQSSTKFSTTEKAKLSSRTKHTQTKETNSNSKIGDPNTNRVYSSVVKRKARRSRRRRSSSPTIEGRTSMNSVDLCLKKAKVVLTRLSTSMVQQYRSENSRPPPILSAVSLVCSKVNSATSKISCPSLDKLERPRRNVKSIYQRGPNTSEPVAQLTEVGLSDIECELTLTPQEVSAKTATVFPEDKRSSSRRRGNSEKKSSETNSRLTELATASASYLLQMTKEDTISAAKGRVNECVNKLAMDSKRNFGVAVVRPFQPPKLITPEELLELKVRLAAEADSKKSTFMKDRLKTFPNVER